MMVCKVAGCIVQKTVVTNPTPKGFYGSANAPLELIKCEVSGANVGMISTSGLQGYGNHRFSHEVFLGCIVYQSDYIALFFDYDKAGAHVC